MFAGQSKKRNVQFIRPPNLLKQKVGSGGLDDAILKKAEDIIGNAGEMFVPFATEVLEELKVLIDDFENRQGDGDDYIEDLIHPIMDLKANGTMLGYPMISHVGDVCLHFIEVIEDINEDAIKIINVAHSALSVIVHQNLSGFNKEISNNLRKELTDACDRYFAKHGMVEAQETVNLNNDLG